MISLLGHVQSGFGKASAFLREQLPLIEREFPEVARCFEGTINVRLDVPLVILTPDFRTSPLVWHAGYAAEMFEFLRIRIEIPVDAAPIAAWLYIAQWSPYRRDPHLHEVIAPRLTTVGKDIRCRIWIDHPSAVEVPAIVVK